MSLFIFLLPRYTPISDNAMLGKFQLLIKRYPAWGDPSFVHNYKPPGVMSNYIHNLKVGDKVRFKHIPFNVKKQYPFTGVRTITMLAVGVGIAPMLQALQAVLTGALAPANPAGPCCARTASNAPQCHVHHAFKSDVEHRRCVLPQAPVTTHTWSFYMATAPCKIFSCGSASMVLCLCIHVSRAPSAVFSGTRVHMDK
jgi:ferredoxin-NADP reductase